MLRVIRVDVDVPDKKNFRTRLRVLNLPKIAIIERRSTPSVVKRTADLVRDGDDAFVFTLPWGRSVEIRAGADAARVGPGEAIITSLEEVGSLHTPLGVRGISLRIARKTALSLAPEAERLVQSPGSARRGGVCDSEFLCRLAHVGPDRPYRLARQPGGPAGPGVAGACFRSRGRPRPRPDVRRDQGRATAGGDSSIGRRLGDPYLSAASVGRRLHLSERYVQQLLEGAGKSFSSYVRELRLKRARQLLGDPLIAHLRIADVAAMAGFNDLSHFNRMFRAYFGETPSDSRRAR